MLASRIRGRTTTQSTRAIWPAMCLAGMALAWAAITTTACKMGREVTDKTAGMNGSFESVKEGVPVNWTIYAPKDADFIIASDSMIVKDGDRSLKFDVRECSDKGGAKSPGFTNEFLTSGKYIGEGRYRVSLWIRNLGAAYRFSAGSVSATGGDMQVLAETADSHENWKMLEYEVHVDPSHWLRVEFNVTEPGTCWVDEVTVERL